MIVAAATIALLSVGCGGEEAGEPGEASTYVPDASTTVKAASPQIARAQFVAQANRICRAAWATVLDNWAKYTSWQDESVRRGKRFEEAVRLSLLAGIDFHIFDDLRDLGSPPGDEQRIEEIIGPFQVAVELGQKERWRARSVAEIPPRFAEYNERARNYGLSDCLVDRAHLRLRPIAS